MSKRWHVSRRTALRGLGTAMSLPLLDAMSGGEAQGAPGAPGGDSSSGKAPVRAAWIFVPNGKNMEEWRPKGEGTGYTLSKTLAPLKKFKDDMIVFSGLTHDKARANGDGAGDHARSAGTFLTGRQCKKTSGKDIRAGVSIDQIAAQKIGKHTDLGSLELGCQPGRQSGGCDSGYSCAYSSNISWRGPSTPNSKEINPKFVFERMFGDATQAANRQKRMKEALNKKSILDLVNQDAKRLRGELGQSDQKKLDEYLDSVRSIERRIQGAGEGGDKKLPDKVKVPGGVPREFREHLRLLADMMVLAFQTDTTRIATFMFANAGSNRNYASVGVRQGHHSLSHHGRNKQKLTQIQKIDQFHVEQYAYLLDRMQSVKEGEGTLLDNSMVLYGSAIGDGNRHNHHDLPIVMAGRGGGTIKTGSHLKFKRDTPLCNLFLEMLDRMGVKEKRFGDSTGRLGQLT